MGLAFAAATSELHGRILDSWRQKSVHKSAQAYWTHFQQEVAGQALCAQEGENRLALLHTLILIEDSISCADQHLRFFAIRAPRIGHRTSEVQRRESSYWTTDYNEQTA
jgi:hypothetical protein